MSSKVIAKEIFEYLEKPEKDRVAEGSPFFDGPDYPLWLDATDLIAQANMAAIYEPGTLERAIDRLNRLIGTGYYDDDEGDELMKHMVKYLTNKLEKAK